MIKIIEFMIMFTLAFLFNYLLNIKRIRKKVTTKEPLEIQYLMKKYNLNIKEINYQKLLFLISLVNAFIISITGSLVFMINNIYWQLIMAMSLLIILIIIAYSLIGKYYFKRGVKKNV